MIVANLLELEKVFKDHGYILQNNRLYDKSGMLCHITEYDFTEDYIDVIEFDGTYMNYDTIQDFIDEYCKKEDED